MLRNLVVRIGNNKTSLHFVCDGKGVRRYGSHGFYDEYKAAKYETQRLGYPTWGDAPKALLDLNQAASNAAPCNLVTNTTALTNFDSVWDYATKAALKSARVLEITVGDTVTYLMHNGHSVVYMPAYSFRHSQFSGVRLGKVTYPCYPLIPFDLRELMKLTFSLDHFGENVIKRFDRVWSYLGTTEVKFEMSENTNNCPYKALMLFDDYNSANGYDHDVYLYSSSGIKRMTFTEYLHLVEAAHSGNYRLVKCIKSALTGLDNTHYDALRKMDSPKNGNKLGTIYMCFRSLWFATTGETMSTTAWKEEE